MTAATHRWIDDDDCALMTARFAAEGYSSAAEGRRACEQDTDPGLESGDYSIAAVRAGAKKATVTIRLGPGRARVLGFVHSPGGWRIDSTREDYETRVGRSLPLREDYLKNGQPVTIDARLTALSVEDAEPPAGGRPAGTGRHWVRAAMRADSRGSEPLEPKIFELWAITSTGARVETAPRAPFTPRFGIDDGLYPRGSTATGFAVFAVEDGETVRALELASTGPDRWRWRVPGPRK